MKNKRNKLIVVVIINLAIFCLVNLLFTLRYEQVDDFIIYNIYSGLDGTYNIHGIYIHPVICFALGLLFRLIPFINWHSIFLLTMQFLCFTIIGYKLLSKFQNYYSIIAYSAFASVFYTSLLLSIQYTSVAALLILTSIFLLIDLVETGKHYSKKYIVLIFSLFILGVMLRMQSLLIVVPFMLIYFFIILLEKINKTEHKRKIILLIKYYSAFLAITLVIYASYSIIYNSNKTYKSYLEYNEIRTQLHDSSYVSYEENKELFDDIGWSLNDWVMFYTFGFGDENIYSKENIKKISDYKTLNEGKISLNSDVKNILLSYINDTFISRPYIIYLFLFAFIISVVLNIKNAWKNILIFITTISLHILFLTLERNVFRVIIPEYILGMTLFLYNMELKKKDKNIKSIVYIPVIIVIILSSVCVLGTNHKKNYEPAPYNYKNIQSMIKYTSCHKENVYLYTVPSLQYRYMAYSVYKMPPKASFSNLRVIGGWDMYTQNYYDFKSRNKLDGTLLDLLKENVYLIDGKVTWSGILFDNYKEYIIQSIEENYDVEVSCKKIKCIKNMCIYKLMEKE